MHRYLVCLTLSTTLACAPLEPSDGNRRLSVDGEVAAVAVGDSVHVTIPFAYSNSTADAVFVPGCSNSMFVPDVEYRVSSAANWVVVWVGIRDLCVPNLFEMGPHSTYRDTFRARVAGDYLTGQFRLSWEVLMLRPDSTTVLVSSAQRVSGPFAIHLTHGAGFRD